ncbi:plectin-like [Scyliorhinus canicula]|uniref:plectin-like n=1 Tax=Scyliorhinus canicula TaxID=7830 RepID=UPI0018F6DDE8|nr:plectin-like [Scyliorhinus canicula]
MYKGQESRNRMASEDRLYLDMLKSTESRKDERDRVQKKTFTKWVNKHLMKAHRSVDDLYEDLRDGHNLISLLEVLSGDSLLKDRHVKYLRLVSVFAWNLSQHDGIETVVEVSSNSLATIPGNSIITAYVDVPHPDEKSIITYVSSLYDALPRVPNAEAGVRANEIELRWQEYYEMVTLLLQWIRHHISMFDEKKFPATYEEIDVIWRQFLKFKESDLPSREIEKNRSKTLYKNLEGAVQEGYLKVPVGYHPIDVEKEWGKLHVSILERERVLRSEFERLERYQRIILKIQQESSLCEEQLKHSDTLLKSDIRLVNLGKPAQNTAVLEHDLDKSDSLIRSLFNDVQTLKDGRHPQAEQMYRRVFRLHEFLVTIRTDYSLRFKSAVQPAIQQVLVPTQSTSSTAMDGATLKYIQDLLEWIEENQRRLEAAEWGVDLPTVQSQLGGHRGLHQSIEDFRAKIERARADEVKAHGHSHSQIEDNQCGDSEHTGG